MVQKSQTTTWDVFENPVQWDLNYQPHLVLAAFSSSLSPQNEGIV